MVNIKVAVRIRPLSQRELNQKDETIVQTNDKSILVTNLKVPERHDGDSRQRIRRFAVDYCYDPKYPEFCTQESVYQDIGKEILESMFSGYNACVLAYGHSASGKTHTMMGKEGDPGLTPRICQGLFQRMNEKAQTSVVRFHVVISFLEIYNERVRDLLVNDDSGATAGSNFSLRVREHPKLGPYVQDLTQHTVTDERRILEFLALGNSRRSTAATENNVHSSRSHAVFTIRFKQSDEPNYETETFSKVHLVDLAGSERAGSTQSKTRLKEGANINKSLVTLGNVISALAESCETFVNQKDQSVSKAWQPFVPYRDSVLTWLLKDTLGGNSNTIMIATISPASSCINETINTLRYAKRTKRIVNQPIINEDPKIRTIRELREEIIKLQQVILNLKVNGKKVVKSEIPGQNSVAKERLAEEEILEEHAEPLQFNRENLCELKNKNINNTVESKSDEIIILPEFRDSSEKIDVEARTANHQITVHAQCTNSFANDVSKINDEKKADVNGSVIDKLVHDTQIFSESFESFSILRGKTTNRGDFNIREIDGVDCNRKLYNFLGCYGSKLRKRCFNPYKSYKDNRTFSKLSGTWKIRKPIQRQSKYKSKLFLKRDYNSSENTSRKSFPKMLHRSRPDLIKEVATHSKDGFPSTSSQSFTDISVLSQSASENSLNSSGSADSQISENQSVKCWTEKNTKTRTFVGSRTKPFRVKLTEAMQRKTSSRPSSVGDGSGSSTPTQIPKPMPKRRADKRSEIVAAVTTRLYETRKKPDPRMEALQVADKDDDDDGELEELKLCKRARMKLFDLSRKLALAKKMKRTVDTITQTDFAIGCTVRLKEKCIVTDQSGILQYENCSTNTPIDNHLKKEKNHPIIMNQVFLPHFSNYVVECGKNIRVEVPSSSKYESGTQTVSNSANNNHVTLLTSHGSVFETNEENFSDDSLDSERLTKPRADIELDPLDNCPKRDGNKLGHKSQSNDNVFKMKKDSCEFVILNSDLHRRSYDSLLEGKSYKSNQDINKSWLPITRYPISGTNILYEYDPNKSSFENCHLSSESSSNKILNTHMERSQSKSDSYPFVNEADETVENKYRRNEIAFPLFNGLPIALCTETLPSNENINENTVASMTYSMNQLLPSSFQSEENESSENSYMSNESSDVTTSSETSSEDFIFFEAPREKESLTRQQGLGDLYTITENSEHSDLTASDPSSPQPSRGSTLQHSEKNDKEKFGAMKRDRTLLTPNDAKGRLFKKPVPFEGEENSSASKSKSEQYNSRGSITRTEKIMENHLPNEEVRRGSDKNGPKKACTIGENIHRNQDSESGGDETSEWFVQDYNPDNVDMKRDNLIDESRGKIFQEDVKENCGKSESKALESFLQVKYKDSENLFTLSDLRSPVSGQYSAHQIMELNSKLRNIGDHNDHSNPVFTNQSLKSFSHQTQSDNTMKEPLPSNQKIFDARLFKSYNDRTSYLTKSQKYSPDEGEFYKEDEHTKQKCQENKLPDGQNVSVARKNHKISNDTSSPVIKSNHSSQNFCTKSGGIAGGDATTTRNAESKLGSENDMHQKQQKRSHGNDKTAKKINWSDLQAPSQRQFLNFNIFRSRQLPFTIDSNIFGEACKKQSSEAKFSSEDSITFVFMAPTYQKTSVLMEIIKRSLEKGSSSDASMGERHHKRSRNRGVQCRLMRSVSVDTAMMALSRFAKNHHPADIARTSSLDTLIPEEMQTILEQGRLHGIRENSCQCNLEPISQDNTSESHCRKSKSSVLKYSTYTSTTRDQGTETEKGIISTDKCLMTKFSFDVSHNVFQKLEKNLPDNEILQQELRMESTSGECERRNLQESQWKGAETVPTDVADHIEVSDDYNDKGERSKWARKTKSVSWSDLSENESMPDVSNENGVSDAESVKELFSDLSENKARNISLVLRTVTDDLKYSHPGQKCVSDVRNTESVNNPSQYAENPDHPDQSPLLDSSSQTRRVRFSEPQRSCTENVCQMLRDERETAKTAANMTLFLKEAIQLLKNLNHLSLMYDLVDEKTNFGGTNKETFQFLGDFIEENHPETWVQSSNRKNDPRMKKVETSVQTDYFYEKTKEGFRSAESSPTRKARTSGTLAEKRDRKGSLNLTWPRQRPTGSTGKPPTGLKLGSRPTRSPFSFRHSLAQSTSTSSFDVLKNDLETSSTSTNWNVSNLSTTFSTSYFGDSAYSRPSSSKSFYSDGTKTEKINDTMSSRCCNRFNSKILSSRTSVPKAGIDLEMELEESCRRLELAVERDRLREENSLIKLAPFSEKKLIPTKWTGTSYELQHSSLESYDKFSISDSETGLEEVTSKNVARHKVGSESTRKSIFSASGNGVKDNRKIGRCYDGKLAASARRKACKCYCHYRNTSKVYRSSLELEALPASDRPCHACCTPCDAEELERSSSAPALNSICESSDNKCRLPYYGYCPCSPVKLNYVKSNPRAYMQHLLSLRRQIVNKTRMEYDSVNNT